MKNAESSHTVALNFDHCLIDSILGGTMVNVGGWGAD